MNSASPTKKKYFVSWSGGKDCSFALYLFLKDNPEAELHLLHMKRIHDRRAHRFSEALLDAQAEAMGLPMTRVLVDKPECYADYFHEALQDMKAQGMSEGVFGDIYLESHRDWIEAECARAGVTPIFPLWNMDVKDIYDQVIEAGFKALIITVQKAYPQILNRILSKELAEEVAPLEGFDICGELGEYHSLMIDGPTFKHPLAYSITGQFENAKLMGNELDVPVYLTLIRHGQTIENTQNICQGQTYGALSPKGIMQAQSLQEELAEEHFDAIYSSDLSRATHSANLIFPQASIIENELLRERSFGDLEGKPLPNNLNFDDDIEGAESLESLQSRIQNFLSMIAQEHRGQKIALISHGVVIKTMLSLCTKQEFSEIAIPRNCTPFRIQL